MWIFNPTQEKLPICRILKYRLLFYTYVHYFFFLLKCWMLNISYLYAVLAMDDKFSNKKFKSKAWNYFQYTISSLKRRIVAWIFFASFNCFIHIDSITLFVLCLLLCKLFYSSIKIGINVMVNPSEPSLYCKIPNIMCITQICNLLTYLNLYESALCYLNT